MNPPKEDELGHKGCVDGHALVLLEPSHQVVAPIDDINVKDIAFRELDTSNPNVVDWDGPKDAKNPRNWSPKKRWFNLVVISCLTFLTPLGSSLPAPVTSLILEYYGSTNALAGSFIISIYVLGFAVGPLCVTPMSEVFGRLPLYHISNVLFVVFNIACAVVPNLSGMLVLRLLTGIAGSVPLTIGGGSIADMFPQNRRGAAMAIWILGPVLGPSIGPIAGGFLGEAAGWQWCFWLMAILGGLFSILAAFCLDETFEPVLLERKAKRMRKETRNPSLRSKLAKTTTFQQELVRALVRPTKMLFMSPIIFCLSSYLAVCFGYIYLMYVTINHVFENVYGFTHGAAGLVYLSNGVGAITGCILFGMVSDRIVVKLADGREMKPEYRLPFVIPATLFIPTGLLWYGWSAEKHAQYMVPIIGTSFIGLGNMASQMPVQTYLIDAYPEHASSATAACTVLRSLVGTFLPIAGPPMYSALGYGWGNTTLALIAFLLAPISWVFYRYGETIRTNPRWQVQF